MHLDYHTPQPKPPNQWLARLIPSAGVYMSALGFVTCAVIAWYWPSNMMFCVPASVGALIIPALDAVWRRQFEKGSLWIARGLTIALVAVLLAYGTTWSPRQTFEHAFTVPPPASVTELVTRSSHAGGPGNLGMVLHFKANRATMDQLIATRGLTLEKDFLPEYQQGKITWAEFRKQPLGVFDRFGAGDWLPAGPLRSAEFYESPRQRENIQSVDLLYDPPTGDAWVLYVSG